MASTSRRTTIRRHPRRAAARGLVRLEIEVPERDVRLVRAMAETLRGKAEKADALRSTLTQAEMHAEMKIAFDIFGSELPDEAFAGVFERAH